MNAWSCAPVSTATARIIVNLPRLNRTTGRHVQDGMDDEHAEALRAEGLDPDDPGVRAAIDPVRWELSLFPRPLRVRVARR
jgi:hypothetical protein